MKLKELDYLYKCLNLPEPELQDFSWLFKFLYKNRFDEIKNLSNVSIGTVLKATHCDKPSEVVKLLLPELKCSFILEKDKVLIYCLIKEQLEIITKLFDQINDIHPIQSKFGGVWNKISSEFKISPDILLIDNISKRNHISWAEAEKLSWSQVYLTLKIDAQNAAFEAETNKIITNHK